MSKVAVVQSSARLTENWEQSCYQSVRHWAQHCQYEHLFLGDELLDLVPAWYRDKVGPRLPIVTDLARLIWIRNLLDQGKYDVVAWLDVDTLVFAPHGLTVAMDSSCVFGYEYWVQQHGNRFRVYRNVHNAYCAFRRGCPVLPFLIDTVQRLVQRVDPDRIAPQFVGPKLLTSLHNIVGFEIDTRFGAISPDLAAALTGGASGDALARLKQVERIPMCAANLCGSLSDQMDHAGLTEALSRYPEGL